MKKLSLVGLIVVVFTSSLSLSAKKPSRYTVTSPDGKIQVEITVGDQLQYSIRYEGTPLLSPSCIGMTLSDGTPWGTNAKVTRTRVNSKEETIESPFYRFSRFTVCYNELDIAFEGHYGVRFRAYNHEGVAYQFYTTKDRELTIQNEQAQFCFPKDHTAYLAYSTNEERPFAMAFQNIYTVASLSEVSNQPAFLPVTIDCGPAKVTLMESDLEAYPGMFVRKAQGTAIEGIFAPYPAQTDYYKWRKQLYVSQASDYIAKVSQKRAFPWRILAIAGNDTQMPVNNLVYALASPNRIGDTGWIKPGKVAWDWWNDWNLKGVPFKTGINMDTYQYYIDFASRNHIEYIILDEGWYAPASGDMLTVVPELDLPALIAYGKERGVDVVLWTVFNVLDDQLEEACRNYAQMGIKGFKVDFLDRDDQTAVEMAYRIAEATARHHLLLDYHGFYKPTGLNRTYPHLLNIESVFGMEEVKWTKLENDMPQYDVTFPFIRMMAGAVDYTPGAMRNATKADWKAVYSNPMSMGTRCHQLATYIVHDSPFTMLCDAPTNYLQEQECVDFITSLPNETDSTFIADGKLGEYLVSVRKRGSQWYIGGLTNWDERDVELYFSFLPDRQTYTATLFEDGSNANRQAQDYQKKTLSLQKGSRLKIHMASGGGFALKLENQSPLK